MERLPQRNRREGKKLAQVARIQARGQLHIPGSNHDATEAEFTEALAAFGLTPDEGEGTTSAPGGLCYLWPCNVPAFNAWQRLQTQWRDSAMGGRTGLDYSAVTAFLRDVLRIKPKALAELFAGIQAMEVAALNVWNQEKQN